ncbi:MAG: hypothetical protein ACK5LC_03875 [Coprobacillaceae bacterium]
MCEVEQQYIEDIINTILRKMFDFETPYDVEYKLIESGAVEIT